jgi:tetratricopeptide (TPR) repeat protein
MRIISKRVFLLVAGISALSLSLALGGEEVEPKKGDKAEKAERKARKDADKRRNRFDRARGNRGNRGRRSNPAGGEMRLANVLDAGYLALAQAHVAKKAPDKAIAVLKELIEKSKDKNAQGFARLALARIYKQQKKEDEAKAELKKVEGLGVIRAIDMLLQGAEDRTAKLEELLEEAKDPLAKAVLIRRLIAVYLRAQDVEKLAAIVERSGKLLTVKQATKALEDELKLAAAGAGGNTGRPDRKQMVQRAQQMRKQMQDRVKELEAAGKKEEAAKLKERLERIDRMMKRFGGREGREGRGDRRKPKAEPKAKEPVDEF